MTTTRHLPATQRTPAGEAAAQEQEKAAADYVNREIARSAGWFGRLLPPPERGGMPAEGFTALVLSQVRRNRDLFAAAVNDIDSLLIAATDAAARNLIPGEEYWFVAFDDKRHGTGPHVTGMPGYKGELQQIYRSGMVESVHCEVVYLADLFRWKPLEMRLPELERRAETAEQMDRRNLRWVVAFARLKGGGISQVVVMNRHQVYLRRDVAKTDKFWNSVWEPEMWMKTALHRLYDFVPRSAGWNLDLARAFATAQERWPALEASAPDTGEALDGAMGAAVPAAIPARAVPPDMPPGGGQAAEPAEGGQPPSGDQAPWPGGAQPPQDIPLPPGDQAPPPGGKITPSTAGRITQFFVAHGWKGEPRRERRRVVIGVAAAGDGPPLDLKAVGDLTEEQGRTALVVLEAIADRAIKNNRPVAADLDKVYDGAVRQRQAGEAGR